MENIKKNVFQTYDLIAEWFSENRPLGLIEKPYLDRVIEKIGAGGTVLDLGCGTGMPMMKYLMEKGMNVTGVDASSRMLEIAEKNFPSQSFIQTDMRDLSLHRKFDAVVAWHSFFHLPTEDQPAMFQIFEDHLKVHGILLFTSGKEFGESWGMNGGQNLFHASLHSHHYEYLLHKYRFKILSYTEDDKECGLATVWMAQLDPVR